MAIHLWKTNENDDGGVDSIANSTQLPEFFIQFQSLPRLTPKTKRASDPSPAKELAERMLVVDHKWLRNTKEVLLKSYKKRIER